MAHIAKRETSMRRNGRPVVRWVVKWQEPKREANGVPVKVVGADGATRTALRHRERAFPSEAEARAFLATVSHDQTNGRSVDYSAGDTLFAVVADTWITTKATERAKPDTVEGYRLTLNHHAIPRFGHRAVGSITPADARAFREALRGAGLSPSAIKYAFAPFRRVLDLAVEDGLIQANPATGVSMPTNTTLDREEFEAHPLSPEEVERVAATLPAPYDLLVLFIAYTGVRAAELAGLDVDSVALRKVAGGWAGTVTIARTKRKKRGGWSEGTPKSSKSRRTVPMPPWLAAEMAAYLATHPAGSDPAAPLWPGRKRGAYDRTATTTLARAASAIDFESRLEPASFYRTVFRAALREAGLPASDSDGTKGVRLHDLRHTFATTALTNGVPYQQVSEWLGHASYVLTLTVYAHWIPKEEDRWVDRMARPAPGPVETRPVVVPIDARRTS